MTYGQWRVRADTVARGLLTQGVDPGDPRRAEVPRCVEVVDRFPLTGSGTVKKFNQ